MCEGANSPVTIDNWRDLWGLLSRPARSDPITEGEVSDAMKPEATWARASDSRIRSLAPRSAPPVRRRVRCQLTTGSEWRLYSSGRDLVCPSISPNGLRNVTNGLSGYDDAPRRPSKAYRSGDPKWRKIAFQSRGIERPDDLPGGGAV